MAAARGRGADGSAVCRRRLLHGGRQGALRCDFAPAPAQRRFAGVAARPQHRPHPRPVAHDDPNRVVAAPLHPHHGAVRRSSSRRCRQAEPRAGDAGEGRDAARLRGPARAGQQGPAARNDLRAHALVGREQLDGPRRRAGAGGRPIPSPGSPRRRPHRRVSRRSRPPTMGSCYPVRRSARMRSPIGRRHARPSGMSSTSHWIGRRPKDGPRGCAATLPRGRPDDAPRCRRRHASRGGTSGWTPSCARFRRSQSEAPLARVAEVALRRTVDCRRTNGATCWPAAPPKAQSMTAPTVCVCFQVGAKRIEAAARAGHRSVEKIGRHLGRRHQLRLMHSRDPPPDRRQGDRA